MEVFKLFILFNTSKSSGISVLISADVAVCASDIITLESIFPFASVVELFNIDIKSPKGSITFPKGSTIPRCSKLKLVAV